jgi:hypothetical protein
MHGRRREARFRPSPAWDGSIETLHDVVPERADRDEVWVLGRAPVPEGSELTLDVGAGVRLEVRVLHTELVMVDGAMRHRLRLRVLNPEAMDEAADSHDTAPPSDRLGAWTRESKLS